MAFSVGVEALNLRVKKKGERALRLRDAATPDPEP
jgi:hypothetical protein